MRLLDEFSRVVLPQLRTGIVKYNTEGWKTDEMDMYLKRLALVERKPYLVFIAKAYFALPRTSLPGSKQSKTKHNTPQHNTATQYSATQPHTTQQRNNTTIQQHNTPHNTTHHTPHNNTTTQQYTTTQQERSNCIPFFSACLMPRYTLPPRMRLDWLFFIIPSLSFLRSALGLVELHQSVLKSEGYGMGMGTAHSIPDSHRVEDVCKMFLRTEKWWRQVKKVHLHSPNSWRIDAMACLLQELLAMKELNLPNKEILDPEEEAEVRAGLEAMHRFHAKLQIWKHPLRCLPLNWILLEETAIKRTSRSPLLWGSNVIANLDLSVNDPVEEEKVKAQMKKRHRDSQKEVNLSSPSHAY